MTNCKSVTVPIAGHFILSKLQCPKTDSEFVEMENIPYANAIGTVMYSMISTRPDLSYSISLLSRYMSNPGKAHWDALKYLLRYINSTLNTGLCYEKRKNTLDLVGFVDADFAGDRDSRKSTTSYYFTVDGNGWIKSISDIDDLVTEDDVVDYVLDNYDQFEGYFDDDIFEEEEE